MTETALKEIVRRAVSDAAFRGQLRTDPAKALAGVILTAEERSALTSGDPAQLTALGVDQRMSKAFIVDASGAASRAVINDPDNPYLGAVTDEATAGEAQAIVGDPAVSASSSEASEWAQSHLRMVERDLDTGVVAAAAGDAGSIAPTHLRMIEQDLDTGGTVEASVDAAGSPPSHLQMIEQDLDTGTAFESAVDSSGATPSHLQMIEQDLDTGATPSVEDVPSVDPNGPTLTES